MIAAAFIVHWRGVVQWAGDHQVEHDLILSRTLVEIFFEPALARALAFRGGTAVGDLKGIPLGRGPARARTLRGPLAALLQSL